MTYSAGIIGSTGRGDYGHSLDTAYKDISEVDVVAVADTDLEAAKKAAERNGAQRVYADYREMIEKENLDLINVCPRRPGERLEMVTACAESGVKGIFTEKPFAGTLADADTMLAACERNGVRIVVGHQKRVSAPDRHAMELIEQGVIGEIQVIRSRGKGDHRAGGEDLVVLGPHMMDSLRMFARSDPASVFGHVSQDGRDVNSDDVYEGAEEIGPIAGNEIGAYITFQNGIVGHFESRQGFSDDKKDFTRSFGLEIHGTKGIISIRNSPEGELYLYPHGIWIPDEAHAKWERIHLPDWERGPDGKPNNHMAMCNEIIARQLISAIENDRDVEIAPTGADARAAVEMIMAIFESHRRKSRIELPLKNRENPFAEWNSERG
jgi:predicted dehydrogenase